MSEKKTKKRRRFVKKFPNSQTNERIRRNFPRTDRRNFEPSGPTRQKMIKNPFRYPEDSLNILNIRGDVIRKMKATVLACLLLTVAAFVGVSGVPPGKPFDDKQKPAPDAFLNFTSTGPLPKLRQEFIKNITTMDFLKATNFHLFNRSGIVGPGGLTLSSVYNTLLSGVHSLYQDLLNRQQAFINLLTCGNCVNEGWDAIMEVVQTIPELDWVHDPQPGSPATFFTAIHQNGTVTGIGGSIVNDRPVAEYAFGNEGIVQHLPNKHKKDGGQ